ncbi:MAG: nucleotidyltransferase [Deltaproteobacteria bacterium]|nr:nucleotidyltransferase [Candidatus Tharpellaceae bacterium]
MPTDYQPEKFKTLYKAFKLGGGSSDRLLIDAFGGDRARLFFPTLKDRMLALGDARKELEIRLAYFDQRWHEIVGMVRRIDAARSLDELVELHRSMNNITVELFLHHVGVMESHQMITYYRHRITEKVIELALARVGKPPCSFAWFNMGSDGRQEQTFFTDQDNALVYEEDGSSAVDDYFLGFADQVVHDLDTAGFALCTGNIMPTNENWRGSYARWREAMEEVFNNQVQENLLRIIILMDVAYCAGSPEVGERFINKVHTMIHEHFDALMTMARSAVMSSVGLNFFKKFRLERSGEHAGKFNVKLFGWAPLIMTTRVFALKYGIQATNTVARLQALEAGHHFDDEFSRRLQKAYLVLTRAKMISQLEAIVSGSKYDYYLDPAVLPDDEREDLREALISVEVLQKLAYNSFFGGIL